MKKLTAILIFTVLIIVIITLLSSCSRKANQNNKTASGNTVKSAFTEASADRQEQASSSQELGGVKEEAGWKTYSHPGYGFSFAYPADLTVSSFNQGEGEVVLVQKSTPPPSAPPLSKGRNMVESEKSSPPYQGGVPEGQGGQGMQIYISLFDEPETTLTKERILQDLPDLKIDNDKQIKIAGVIDALRFDSANQSGENTKEVWFVYNNFLYQISAVVDSEAVLEKMIGTWKFN